MPIFVGEVVSNESAIAYLPYDVLVWLCILRFTWLRAVSMRWHSSCYLLIYLVLVYNCSLTPKLNLVRYVSCAKACVLQLVLVLLYVLILARSLRRLRAPPRRILLTCASPPPNLFAASQISQPAEYFFGTISAHRFALSLLCFKQSLEYATVRYRKHKKQSMFILHVLAF